MTPISRRQFLRAGTAAAATFALGRFTDPAAALVPAPPEVPAGPRPPQDPSVAVLHPRGRVPLSFIIDDSTCLVNMGAYCMPQFNAAWPQNPVYWRKWKEWPREIPDAFVREFGEWCGEQGVRGKYSIVPMPACVGWLDRELPGWSRKELKESLQLVRELMVPRWDITPEMITHTRVIDLKTGRPVEPSSPATMENSYPPEKKSADELAEYIATALRVLKNCELPADAVTTPGGFGNKCKAELSVAMRQAILDVSPGTDVPHYFKYIAEGDESTRPRIEGVEGLGTDSLRFTANVPAGCGDWFGNWDGDRPPQGDKYATADASAGRMPELIDRGEPAVMFCHWAGLYGNGTKAGFEQCKRVITAINTKYRDRTVWMKTSELARYEAARQLTTIARAGGKVTLTAPVACPAYTLKLAARPGTGPAGQPAVTVDGKRLPLEAAKDLVALKPGTWLRERDGATVVCLDLGKGTTVVEA
ncbi:MAG TPA: twin-arginine translocation signal domain-containing protein [Humisphaera sp.]